MKDIRFMLQDFAELNHYRDYLEAFYFHNPFTGLDKDLILNKIDNIIYMPSLKWVGTFTSFWHQFGEKTQHKFYYPNPDPLTSKIVSKIFEIEDWAQKAFQAQNQLRKNLDQTYRAGFQTESQFHVELWAGPKHPYYLPNNPEFNRIFIWETDTSEITEENFKDDYLFYLSKRILQTMNETDLVTLGEMRLVYKQHFTYRTAA